MLAEYQAQTQNLLNDAGGQFFQPTTLTNFVNRARRRVALASGCVRVLLEAKTVAGQEEYKFRDWLALVQATPGVREIHVLRTLAIAIGPGSGAWKPAWNRLPWSDFQARFRIWNYAWRGTISYPGFFAQYGFGTAGSLFLAPIPDQIQPMEMDCSCLPFPLETDDDPECVPQPWQDAVPYYASFLAMLGQQRPQDTASILQIFQSDLPFCASVVAPTLIQSPYGAIQRSV